jgi:Sec-independent protein translocase protein TatA
MVALILGTLAVVAVVAVLVFATSRLESGRHLGEPI